MKYYRYFENPDTWPVNIINLQKTQIFKMRINCFLLDPKEVVDLLIFLGFFKNVVNGNQCRGLGLVIQNLKNARLRYTMQS